MRLYLLKDAGQDLYVDFPTTLPQHQIDGIRFLYKQLKKKNPGVILSDPPGYGKRMQVALFLKAIRPLLQKPIFVICPKESITTWKEHFLEWAGYEDNDIAVETSNAFAKHLVFINTAEDVSAFCRRHWSIVFIDNNDFHKDTANVTKKVLHFALNSEFKIWVTSVDIKARLDLFPCLYHWLNPGDKTNIHDFTPKGNGLKDDIAKSIILEAFLEDIVIRRNNFLTPFKSIETEDSRDEDNLQEISRKRYMKCKDITGKKVKRSKKRVIEDDDLNFSVTALNNSTMNIQELSASRYDDSVDYFNFENKNAEVTKNNEMNIETFICDQEPTKSAEANNANDVSQTDGSTSVFQNAVNDIVKSENSILRHKQDSPSLFDIVEENNMKMEMKDFNAENSSFMQSAKLIAKSKDVPEDLKIEIDKSSGILKGNCNASAIKDGDLLFLKEKETILNIRGEKVNVKEDDYEEIIVNVTSNSIPNKCEVSIKEIEEVSIKNKESNSSFIQNINEEVSVKNEPEKNKDILEQISDLEKEVLKRFKGSILDTLFNSTMTKKNKKSTNN